MRVIPVELDADMVAALEVERELLGFENRSAYIRWVLEYRATIDNRENAERSPLLEAYRERIAQLEARLEEAESTVPDAETSVFPSDWSRGLTPSGDRGGEPEGSGSESEAGDGGWTPSRSDPSVEVRGSPRTTVWSDPADEASKPESVDCVESTTTEVTNHRTRAEGDDGRIDDECTEAERTDDERIDDECTEAERTDDERTDAERTDAKRIDEAINAANLTPERVERIREDPVAEDAGVLGNVEVDRLDELSRRAVAKTRKRLDRNVQTGLEYTSSTGLADGDVRLGEDVIDLESLSVPGHSDELVDARRELAGYAIAYLRDEGRARRSEFVDALYEEYPAGYETTDSWWRCLKRALKQVEAIDGGSGARVWRFER